MDLMSVALIGLAISLVLSAILTIVILPPTRSVLRRLCPTGDAISFWTRFTVLMLFLGPLLVTLVFGLPYSEQALKASAADLVIRVTTSALVGAFLTLGCIGVRMGTMRPTMPTPTPPVRKTDDEFIK